ncbi:MAG TPA: D-2-hydroxyacid dehydrogenase, partial [Bacillota bacterium]|nr:D-2-hydroxyacid dehydrogenase [Bacillota bacterium]
KARVWKPLDVDLLNGKVLGIVGFGSIGEEIGRRAKSFGMKVIGLKRRKAETVDRSLADDVWGDEDLDRLLTIADHVVVAVPLTPVTRGLISRERLALMKNTAVIYNIARGAVIDENALIEALREKRIAGAGLDVFETEPLPETSALWEMDNVIVTPHSAGGMPDYRPRAFAIFLDNLRRLRDGETLINEVDKEAGY